MDSSVRLTACAAMSWLRAQLDWILAFPFHQKTQMQDRFLWLQPKVPTSQ